MREFKFRAWDENNKIMHNNFQFIKSGNEGNDWIIFISDKQKLDADEHQFKNPYFQQQFKIMQYTGFKDITGTEIYEGDIIKTKYLIVYIHWNNVCGKWYKNYISSDYSGIIGDCELNDNISKFKIIGNRFENPELMV